MRKIIISVLLLGVIGFLMWKNFAITAKPSITVKQTTESKVKVQNQKPKISVQQQIKETAQQNKVIKEHIQVFNPDPAIDALLLKLNFNQCIQDLTGDVDDINLNSLKSNNTVSKSQKQYKQNFHVYCEKLEIENPHYLLRQNSERKLIAKTLDKKTEIGKIVSGYYNSKQDYQNIDIKKEVQILKDTDPNLLLAVPRYFRNYNDEILVPVIEEILKTHQQDYILLLIKHAHILYACNTGARCNQYSEVVAKLCIQNNLCGSSYDDILNHYISPGMLKDIQLTYMHLLELYE